MQLLALLALVLLAAAAAALDAGEVRAMSAMKAAWGASAPANWVEPPSCSWDGIMCGGEGEGHVVEVNLYEVGLVGCVPPEVGLLGELQTLFVFGRRALLSFFYKIYFIPILYILAVNYSLVLFILSE